MTWPEGLKIVLNTWDAAWIFSVWAMQSIVRTEKAISRTNAFYALLFIGTGALILVGLRVFINFIGD